MSRILDLGLMSAIASAVVLEIDIHQDADRGNVQSVGVLTPERVASTIEVLPKVYRTKVQYPGEN